MRHRIRDILETSKPERMKNDTSTKVQFAAGDAIGSYGSEHAANKSMRLRHQQRLGVQVSRRGIGCTIYLSFVANCWHNDRTEKTARSNRIIPVRSLDDG